MIEGYVYISGKITDNKDAQRQFAQAEKTLRHMGYTHIFNPYAACHSLAPFLTHKDFMKISLKVLVKCKYIYMLIGSKKSKGSVREFHFAKSKGLDILYQDEQN